MGNGTGVTIEKYLSGSNLTTYLSTANSFTLNNYLIEPMTIVNGTSEVVPLVDPTTTLTYGGFAIGQIKPHVLSNLVPGTTGNAVYMTFITYLIVSDAYHPGLLKDNYFTSTYKPAILTYLNQIKPEYIIWDNRGNAGGYGLVNGMHVFGNATSIYYNKIATREDSSKTLVQASNYQNILEIYNNQSKYVSTFSNIVNGTRADVDGNTWDVSGDNVRLRFGNTDHYDPGFQSNLVYMLNTGSVSSAYDHLMFLKNFNENLHDIGANTHVTTYGSFNQLGLGADYATLKNNNGRPPDVILPTLVDALDTNPFRIYESERVCPVPLYQNETLSSEGFGAGSQIDGLSDYTTDNMLQEIGAVTNNYGTVLGNDLTWRDFRLERAIQQAIRGPGNSFINSGTPLPSSIF